MLLLRWYLVDASCEDELSAKQAEVIASFIDATCLEDASTLTASENQKAQSFSLFLSVSLSLKMQHRDDDPSGTAPKTTLYETEPGLSGENAMAVCTRLISVFSPLC